MPCSSCLILSLAKTDLRCVVFLSVVPSNTDDQETHLTSCVKISRTLQKGSVNGYFTWFSSPFQSHWPLQRIRPNFVPKRSRDETWNSNSIAEKLASFAPYLEVCPEKLHFFPRRKRPCRLCKSLMCSSSFGLFPLPMLQYWLKPMTFSSAHPKGKLDWFVEIIVV